MDSSTRSAFSRIYAPEFVGLLGNMKLSNTPGAERLDLRPIVLYAEWVEA